MSTAQPEEPVAAVLIGGGEMGALMRSSDWSQTSLGVAETWSQSLKTALSILLNACGPMFLVWGDDRILLYNDAYSALLRESNVTLPLGQPLKGNTTGALSTLCSQVEQVFSTGRSLQCERQSFLLGRDGHRDTTVYTCCYSPLWDEGGQVSGVFATGYQISSAADDRSPAEIDLPDGEADFRDLFNLTSVGMTQIDAKTRRFLCVNNAFCAFTGYSEAELLALTVDDLNHPEDRDRDWQHYLHWLQEDATSYQSEKRYLRKDGSTVWVLATGHMIRDAEGQALHAIAVIQDITERKQSEANLQESKERFYFVTQAVNGLIFDWNLQTNAVYRSEKLYDLVGVNAEDAPPGADWWHERMHPDDVARLQPEIAELFASSKPIYETEYRVRHEDGQWVDVWEQACLLRDEQGQVTRIVGCTVDISERKRVADERQRAELALREKEQQLQQLSDSMPQFVWISSSTGKLEYVNQQWAEFSGLTLEQTQDQAILAALYHPDDRQRAFDQWAIALASKQTFEVEARLRRSVDGTYRWFLIRAVPGFSEQGQVLRWYGTSTDIHERKRRELHDQFLNQLDMRLRQFSDVQDLDVQDLMWETVSSLGDYLQLSRCTFVEIDWPRGLAIVERDWCRDVPSVAGTCTISDFITPEFQAAMAAGQAAIVHDVTTDPRTAAFASHYEAFQTRAFANAPCIYQGRWVADLTVSSKTPRVWRDDEVALLQETIARVWPLIEQTRAMRALRESENRLQMALEGSGGGFWDWHITADEVYMSPRWLEMLGYQAEDLPRNFRTWEDLIHPDDQAWVLERTQAHLQDDSVPYRFEYRLLSKSGEWKWIASYGKVVMRDEQGRPLRMAGIHHDISDRKTTETALQQSEERFRISQELSLDAFTILDSVRDQTGAIVDFVWTYVNPKAAEMLQRDADDLVGQRLLEVLPNQRPLFERYVRVVDTGEPHDIELYDTSGMAGWLRNMVVKLKDGVAVFASDITDRKRNEAEREQLLQELATERSHFEAILRQMPAGVIIAEAPSGKLILGNQQAEQIWRHPFRFATEIDEYREYEGFHPDGRAYEPEEWPLARSLMRGEVVTQEEIRFLRGDGTEGVMEISSTPIYNQQGQIISGVVIFQDVTDRQQIEEALRTSEERLRFAVEGAALGTWEYDLASSQIVWSERCKLMFGIPLDAEVDYEVFMQALHLEDRDRIHAAVEQAIAQHDVYDVEMRSVWTDGSIHWIRSIGRARYDHQGIPTRMIGVALDITERKQAETALRQSEERYRYLVEVTPQLVWTADAQGRNTYVSQQTCDYIGLSFEQLLNLNWQTVIHPDDVEQVERRWMDSVQNHTPYEAEYRLHRSDGVYRWQLVRAMPFKDEQGQILQWFGVSMDISDRKQAEEDLQESERRFRRLVESNMFGVAFGDFAGGIHYANDYFLNMIGYTREELEKRQVRWIDITPAEFLPLDEKAAAELKTRGVATAFEKEYIRKDGRRVPILIGSALLQESCNQQPEIIAFYLDLTEQKQAEAERERLLQQAQAAREEAETANRIKDEFLAVLSHELRSPLNPILGWSKLLQTQKFDQQNTQRALETIERNAKLQTQLIDDLLDVSRILRGKMALNICPVHLVPVIESALETVRLAAEAKRVQIQTVVTLDHAQVFGDSARLQQIVWNLLSNAVKFTPNGGQVEVCLSSMGHYAQIQVIDTGKGISPEFLPYVFDYFRQEDGTTTRKFGGLGLGLAIVRHLTELHGGTVHAESAGLEQGAIFTVRLPLVTDTTDSGEQGATTTPTLDFSQFNILVVDDDEDMRNLVQVILAQEGVQVRVATSAAEALLMFDQQLPHLLISDIGMPEMDGYQLMQHIRHRSPEAGGLVPAIALTAYAGEYDQQQALKAGFQTHISKPVEPDALVHAISELLRAGNPTTEPNRLNTRQNS